MSANEDNKSGQVLMTTQSPDVSADTSTSSGQNMSIGFKLDGRVNYTTWRFAMNTLLAAYGLEDYIDSKKSPTDPVKKAKTMLAITRNMEMSQLSVIKSFANDPAGAWAALSNEYAGKSSQDMATLLIEL